MLRRYGVVVAAAVLFFSGSAFAQSGAKEEGASKTAAAEEPSKKENAAPKLQHYRPVDQRGINIFEPPKYDNVPFSEPKFTWGVSISQPIQGLKHKNTALPKFKDGVNTNALMPMGLGFSPAGANLYLNAQIEDGIRVQLTMYLSSRHHTEAWVKDGYILVDRLPIKGMFGMVANALMDRFGVTVRTGHFEINYGDSHFRRSDNGQGLYNPFIGNPILDSFATEIGGEIYIRPVKHAFLMAGVTGGEIKGNVLKPQDRSPAVVGKVGYDRQVNPDLRVRLTGSLYTVKKSVASTLYAGDRAGSRYVFAMGSPTTTSANEPGSGTMNPQFGHNVTAMQVNPFLKYRNLEFFGIVEKARGRTAAETSNRTWHQYAADVVYRLAGDTAFVGGRYNTASGQLPNISGSVSVNRVQVGGGLFLTRNMLMKAEYVDQRYHGFPSNNILNGGKFHGVVMEVAVSF